MYTTPAPSSTAPWAPQRASPPQPITSDMSRNPSPAMSAEILAGYDPILLVEALEEIDARRVAIEWLLDADLLCVCLV